MDLLNEKYVILEIIPTGIDRDHGEIVQLSALKLDGLKLIDRFDYRLNEEKVPIQEFIDMCSYDKDSFNYVDNTDLILDKFKEFVGDLPLLIIDNSYTRNFLNIFDNNKECVFNYMNINNNDDSIQEMINKYKLEESNYIVDLIYEALIRELQ
ncbi:MAG: hypothetical protein MRZ42_01285 [Tenericutes bacterium]|nr:hypothetical protein [Mycoplasmatota bacterium]